MVAVTHFFPQITGVAGAKGSLVSADKLVQGMLTNVLNPKGLQTREKLKKKCLYEGKKKLEKKCLFG